MNANNVELTGRPFLQELLKSEKSVLEIGPFCNPVLIGENVKYFDVLDRNGLINRANSIGYNIVFAPEISFVSPNGDLSVVDEMFTAALSCHCIEHQPDLISHLQSVSYILESNGSYYLIIPDKRFCFDALISPSSMAEVVAAHIEKRQTHTIRSVIEHRALTTHNDPKRHWDGDHVDFNYEQSVLDRIPPAITEFISSNGNYIDVHAWQFVPETFSSIINGLRQLGYIDFEISYIAQPILNHNEFIAILRKTK